MDAVNWISVVMAGLALLGQVLGQLNARLVARDKMQFDEKMGALQQQNTDQQADMDRMRGDLNGVGSKYAEVAKANQDLTAKHDSCEKRCLVLETKIDVLEHDRGRQAETIAALYAKVHAAAAAPPTVVVVNGPADPPKPAEAPKDAPRPDPEPG